MREQLQTPIEHGRLDRPGTVARRLGGGAWRRGRLALGVLLTLTAVLGGAAALRQADQTIPLLVAGRDLPSGVALGSSDLRTVQARLPAEQLALYARPGDDVLGASLTAPLPAGNLVPLTMLASETSTTGLVEYPIPIEPDALPGGLRPGDRVAVAVGGEGNGGRGRILLPPVEVIRLPSGESGFGGPDRIHAVEVRLPADRLAAVAGAVAGGRVSLARVVPGSLSARTGPDAGASWPDAAGGATDPLSPDGGGHR